MKKQPEYIDIAKTSNAHKIKFAELIYPQGMGLPYAVHILSRSLVWDK